MIIDMTELSTRAVICFICISEQDQWLHGVPSPADLPASYRNSFLVYRCIPEKAPMDDLLNAILEMVQNSNRKNRYKELVRIPKALPGVLALYNEICFNSLRGSNWCYIRVTTVRCPKGRYLFLRGFSQFICSIHLPFLGFKSDSLLNVLAPIPRRES